MRFCTRGRRDESNQQPAREFDVRPAFLKAGAKVDRYELIRPLGAGGAGTVYEAMDPAIGRRIAVKVCHLPGDAEKRRVLQARFLREARAAGRVRHPSAVNVFDFGTEDDRAFLVMELVEGETLAQRLKRGGPIGVTAALDLLLPVFSAVAALHANGVLHRDIKPANILLEGKDAPRAKLADFGLSRFIEEDSSITESGVMLGTPDYMAPEIVRRAGAVSERSDQYALAIVFYECLTGTRPFRGAELYELLHEVICGTLLRPSVLVPSLPEELDSAIVRAMSRDPEQRFGSVDDFARALASPGMAAGGAHARMAHAPRTDGGTDRPVLRVSDGIAVVEHGDAFIVLWKEPARVERMRWMLDAAERFALGRSDGFVALVVVLPTSSSPDALTLADCIGRLLELHRVVRRQATVALGGKVWQAVVRSVHRVMGFTMLPRSGSLTLSGTLEEGVALLLEKASHVTPSFEEIVEDLRFLHEALGVAQPGVEVGVAPAASTLDARTR
jgi:serine/threonine-protein kinase